MKSSAPSLPSPPPDGSPALSLDIQLTHIGFAGTRARVNGGSDVARDKKIRPRRFFTSLHDPLSSLQCLANALQQL